MHCEAEICTVCFGNNFVKQAAFYFNDYSTQISK